MKLDRLAAPALGLGLLLTGCGAEGNSDSVPEDISSIPLPSDVSEAHVDSYYFSNGTRELVSSVGDGYTSYAKILQFCDGYDLMEQTDFNGDTDSGAGNAIDRTVGHPACANGILTPEDFPATDAVTVHIVQ